MRPTPVALLGLTCLSFTGHGHTLRMTTERVQYDSDEQHQSRPQLGDVVSTSQTLKELQTSAQFELPSPFKALAAILLSYNPAAGRPMQHQMIHRFPVSVSAESRPYALGDFKEMKAMDSQRHATSQMSTITSAAPSKEIWNEEIKEAWIKAYESSVEKPAGYEITKIDGKIPAGLRGTIFRNGPGNFERGGVRYEHVLDGDGLLCKFSIDGSTGRAKFASRFVATPEYVEEVAANTIMHRNTFGTQPPGLLSNFGNVVLKNPANTNIQIWGGKLLALWEAALPCLIDPKTLSYEGRETFDGMLPDGSLTVYSGLGMEMDRSLGLGVAMTAHPHEDRKRGRMVSWTWAAPLVGDTLSITMFEWDTKTGKLLTSTSDTLPSPIAPHDFAITDNFYVFALNAMELKLAPFLMGLTGPVGALLTTGGGVTLKLIPRPDGNRAGSPPITINTDDPYFAIHHATAFEEIGSPGDAPLLRIYTAAWPQVGQGPFLGDWGGAVPFYDDGKINPTLMLETKIRLSDEPSIEKAYVADKACIDHPHVDPRFDGDPRVRYIYMSYCNAEGVSGSPPLGWARFDIKTGKMAVWRAPPRTFCEEIVVIPRPRGVPGEGVGDDETDEADVWLAGMMFDADSGRSSLAIFDGDNIEAGPVCRLWLESSTPHGLHGTYTPELFDEF